MHHDGIRNRDWERTARRGLRRIPLLLGALIGVWLAACSGDVIVFVGDPLPGDPRIAVITLDLCECDSCRIAIDDPEGGEIVFNMTDPPLDQSIVADACYNTEMIRIVVECGGCPLMVNCKAEATLRLEGEVGGVTMTETLPDPLLGMPPRTVRCEALPGSSCNASETFDISTSALINPACPI